MATTVGSIGQYKNTSTRTISDNAIKNLPLSDVVKRDINNKKGSIWNNPSKSGKK